MFNVGPCVYGFVCVVKIFVLIFLGLMSDSFNSVYSRVLNLLLLKTLLMIKII